MGHHYPCKDWLNERSCSQCRQIADEERYRTEERTKEAAPWVWAESEDSEEQIAKRNVELAEQLLEKRRNELSKIRLKRINKEMNRQ